MPLLLQPTLCDWVFLTLVIDHKIFLNIFSCLENLWITITYQYVIVFNYYFWLFLLCSHWSSAVAYLGFQKWGPNFRWPLVLTQWGGKLSFPNFSYGENKNFFAKGAMAPLNTPLVICRLLKLFYVAPLFVSKCPTGHSTVKLLLCRMLPQKFPLSLASVTITLTKWQRPLVVNHKRSHFLIFSRSRQSGDLQVIESLGIQTKKLRILTHSMSLSYFLKIRIICIYHLSWAW